MPFPDIDPIAFQFTVLGFTLALRWYALAYIVGIIGGWWLAGRIVRRDALWGKVSPITPKHLEDFVTWAILGIIVGGRLGYVIFYQPAYFLSNPAEIIRVWDGGMSFHGGFLGVVVAIIVYAWRNGIPLLNLADLIAVVAPIGLLLGRIANFVNAELWGRPTTVPWGVSFPGSRAQICPEFWPIGPSDACIRHPSQLYEAALEGLVLFAVLLFAVWVLRILRRPGVVTGMFFIGYGLARTFVEFFRQGDVQYVSEGNPFGQVIRFGDSAWAGLSMGQILSLPMIAIGIGFLLWSRRAK
ncbi:phosphatidylglycerol:prolipoprotein diacylglycerol transferase [Monaibacterium marinum]|uniref:Phosphatidylglycerol--prolipoprotein diacylglyceryl transferase n=1 Tax=Pontivivens marinum TaxID=1690039 RepID=A0A2C9CSI9_9RHOB|nr:prolipoprotein diacylglyceryl transferase [Monaibacterium marinum]SOH94183.1 phosphatidylglycerol:prolipoprotein diacylglycerol transferase [Monaibacterium marinum]